MKKMKNRSTNAIIITCVAIAAILVCFLCNNIFSAIGGTSGHGTLLEFKADSSRNSGFSREAIIYTENKTIDVAFSGSITTDGTAEISILSYDGTVTFSQTYSAVNSKKIKIEVLGLTPQTYYILRFSSKDAKTGHLVLTTEQSLVERPEVPMRPKRPERTIPDRTTN